MKAKKEAYKHSSGFKTPAGYFKNLEEEICNTNSLVETLKNKKNAGFVTPKSYFEDLEHELLESVTQHKKPKVRALFNKELLLYAASIAAIVIALASTFYLNPKSETNWDIVQLSVMENYIDNNNMDFSTAEISNYIFSEGYIVDESDLNDLNTNAMVDYLDENMEDPIYILENR